MMCRRILHVWMTSTASRRSEQDRSVALCWFSTKSANSIMPWRFWTNRRYKPFSKAWTWLLCNLPALYVIMCSLCWSLTCFMHYWVAVSALNADTLLLLMMLCSFFLSSYLPSFFLISLSRQNPCPVFCSGNSLGLLQVSSTDSFFLKYSIV